MRFNAKVFFLVVFFILLLVGIPAAVYMLQQQQIIEQQAQKATTLSFEPVSSSSNPIIKQVGDDVVLDVMVEPSTNVVSSINIDIQYDSAKLATVSASAFVVNDAIFNSVLVGPVYSDNKITANLAISDPTKALTTKTKAVTITFKALAPTETGIPTQVTYTANSRATSRGPNDQALEDVLSSTLPAYITINGGAQPTSEPTATPVPSEEPQPTATEAPTPTLGQGGPASTPPDCIALTLDQSTGPAPLTVTFTANGNDSDGTVNKATFNFGDGQVSDLTSGFGLGTDTANAQIEHTYTSAGTFQATAILTDDTNEVSTTANCVQNITVTGDASATPVPTVAPAGTTEVLFAIGAVSLFLVVGGALLFFIL